MTLEVFRHFQQVIFLLLVACRLYTCTSLAFLGKQHSPWSVEVGHQVVRLQQKGLLQDKKDFFQRQKEAKNQGPNMKSAMWHAGFKSEINYCEIAFIVIIVVLLVVLTLLTIG